MKKNVIFLLLLLFGAHVWAQDRNFDDPDEDENFDNGASRGRKSLVNSGRKEERKKPPISAYKMISIKGDTTIVDTTLTLQKDYKFNYLRRDDFELQPIHNVGQTYNSLAKREEKNHLLPLFGARARHFNFMEVDDIYYYHVPTPFTELYFRTTFEQGQQLDSFFTVNTSPQLNLTIAYKGVRSLGKYQHALTSIGNFRSMVNYTTKNQRYQLKTHFVSQDLSNEENGGLSEEGIEQYLGLGEFSTPEAREDFADRGAIAVNFENAESILIGKRFYLNHQYAIIKKTDSSSTELAIGHVLDLTDKTFRFTQDAPSVLFGESYQAGGLFDDVALEDFTNQGYLSFANKWFGNLKLIGGASNYNYGYNTTLQTVDESGVFENITNRIKGDVSFAGGEYKNKYKGFGIFAGASSIFSGDFEGNYFNAGVGYNLSDDLKIEAKLGSNSVAPNYNFLLYQSDYIDYNWQNDFENTKTQKVQLKVKAKKIAELDASYSIIDNYTYFAKDGDSITVPLQNSEKINLLKVKLSQGIKFWKIGLENTVMYQQVEGGDQIYNVPEIITRNTLYYQDRWFRKALFLQTGVTLKYFTKYNADGYDPILSEFYVQNEQEFGGFPQIDLFFNAKVRQTRVYFKVENFGEAFSQNLEFSAPGYATRDAVIRFGLIWNFFL